MTIEEQKRELLKLIANSLTIGSDEMEGTQKIDIETIHGCNTDYIDYTEPAMSLDDIVRKYHLPIDTTLPDGSGGWPPDGYQPSDGRGPEDGLLDVSAGKDDDGRKFPDDNRTLDDIVNDIINDSEIGPTRAIVEFAQPCIRDSKGVLYELYIKPGQELNENTMIGKAVIDDKSQFIKSIFSQGTVMSENNDKDFYRIFKGAGADRHFIVDHYSLGGQATELNPEKLQEIQDLYKDEAELHQLITDNLCESALPFILSRRYDNWIGNIPPALPMHIWRKNGREIYQEFMEYVRDIRERYSDDMRRLADGDNIKKTNGNMKKMNELGDRILRRRRQYADEITDAYLNYKKSLDKSEYDPDYEDCKYLAYVQSIGWGLQDTTTKIGDEDYFNYYVALLSKLDLRTENKWVKRYYDLLKGIIEERITVENYNIGKIKTEFNKLFKSIINPRMRDGFQRLDRAMNEVDGDVTMADAAGWISQNNKTGIDEYKNMQINQLASMYMFIRNYKAYNPQQSDMKRNTGKASPDEKKLSVYELTKKENRKLEEFWSDALAAYAGKSTDDCIRQTKEFADKLNQYATWPTPTQIRIGQYTYDHYLFQNSDRKMKKPADDDLGTDVVTDQPEVPDDIVPPDASLRDMPLGDDNISADEITILDIDYWKRYFALATIISLPFLNCGLDIPTVIMMVPLPAIYIAISCVFIKPLDLLLVIGISIRGMYVWPVFLYVNCSNMPLSIMTPLISQVKNIKSKISAKINALAEEPINAIADNFIKSFEENSRSLRQQNKLLENYINSIAHKKTANQEEIKSYMNKLYAPFKKQTQQVIDPLGTEKSEEK